MRSRFTLSLVSGAAAILALLVWWRGPGLRAREFHLEMELGCARGGRAQVYFDRGAGFNEADSASQSLPAATAPARVRFPLPGGLVRALRFDPVDHDGPVVVSRARIVNGDGQVVRSFGREDFRPAHQIAAIVPAGESWEVRPEAGANDPYLELKLGTPLMLTPDWPRMVRQALGVIAATLALVWGWAWLATRTGSRELRSPAGPPLYPAGHWALIDEVKGAAMLLVLIYHTGGMLRLDNVIHGEVGVDVFLVVTGLMLAARSVALPARDFLQRRFLRLLPAYWLALGLFVGLHRLVHGEFQPFSAIGLHAIGLHGFVAEDQFFAINDSFWYLSLLFACYGVFLLVRAHLADLSLLIGVGGGLTGVACVAYAELGHQAGLIHLAIRIPSFFAGLIIGQILSGRGWVLRLNGAFAGGVATMGFLVMYRGIFVGYLIAALAIIALVAVVHRALRAVPWLAWWPALLGGIGALSYEIYLLHQPLMRDYSVEAWRRWTGLRQPSPSQRACAIAVAFVGVLVLAWLLHRLVERRRRGPGGIHS